MPNKIAKNSIVGWLVSDVPLSMEQVFVKDNPNLNFRICEKFSHDTIFSYPALTDKDKDRLLKLVKIYSEHSTVFDLEMKRITLSITKLFYTRSNELCKNYREIIELFELMYKALGLKYDRF